MLDIQKFIWSPKIVVDEIDDTLTRFEVQFLPRGFGHTLGNGLRRAVLWYSAWWAVTWLQIKWVDHEYSVIEWVKESVLDIMSNFKKLRFKVDETVDETQWVSQKIKWQWAFTAKDLKLPSGVELLNEDVVLVEISDSSVTLDVEVRLEKGYGYYSVDFLRTREEEKEDADINVLLIDNDFKAVDYIKYSVEEEIDDFSGWSKDKLILDIKTVSKKITAKEILSFAGEVVSSYARLFVFDDAYIDSSMLVDYYDIVDKQEKEREEKNVKTIPIDALPLSERTRNALIKNEVLYVEELEEKRKSELLTMKWIWKKAVDEIIESLWNMGKTLAWSGK